MASALAFTACSGETAACCEAVQQFARAVVTKNPGLVALTIKVSQAFIFSQFKRLDVQDQGVGRFGSFRGLTCCLVDGHLLFVSSQGLSCE